MKNLKSFVNSIFLFLIVMTILSFTSCKEDDEVEVSTNTNIQVNTNIDVSLSISNVNVKKGETIDLTTGIKGTVNGNPVIFNVIYYIDDIEIGKSSNSENNYLVTYLVKDDLLVGTHTIKSVASYCENSISLRGEAAKNVYVSE